MTGPRYFVILGAMRTGSNLLEQIIAGLPGTICHGEAFNPAFIGGPRRGTVLGWTRKMRDADPMGFLAALLADAGDRLPGFRLFDGHDGTVLDHVLSDPDCARIVLRRDPLDSFVSLGIARETDQWLLRNARRRQTARIRFDGPAYDSYRSALAAHYDRVAAGMAAAGTTALHLDYAGLNDPDLPGRLAAHLGLPPGPVQAPTLVRQNPGPLRAKVANYPELCTHLGLDPEPLAPEPLPGPDDYLLARHAPLALAPIPGPGLLPAMALIHRIDCRLSGEPHLGRGAFLAAAADGTLLPAGPATGRHTVAIISHPVRRLGWLLHRALFGDSPAVRALLADRHPDLPTTPKAWTIWPEDRREAVVADLLDIVEDTLANRGDLSCPAAWATQATFLDALGAPAPQLFTDADFTGLARALTDAAGLAPFPAGQCRAIAAIAPAPDLAMTVADARARSLHRHDFTRLAALFGGAPG